MEFIEAKQILNENGFYLTETKKYTRSLLRHMACEKMAKDITNLSFEEIKELRANKRLEKIGVSFNHDGMQNAALFEDEDGNRYVILARNTNLMYLA